MHSRQAKLLAYAENLAEKTAAKSKSGTPVLFKYTDPKTGKDFYLTEKKMTGVRSPYSGMVLQGVTPEKDTLSDVGKEVKEDAKAQKAQKAQSRKAALLAILQGTAADEVF